HARAAVIARPVPRPPDAVAARSPAPTPPVVPSPHRAAPGQPATMDSRAEAPVASRGAAASESSTIGSQVRDVRPATRTRFGRAPRTVLAVCVAAGFIAAGFGVVRRA